MKLYNSSRVVPLVFIIIIVSLAYLSIGYNSKDTVTLVHYGPDLMDTKIVDVTGFYNKFGSTDYEVYKRKPTHKE